jgi:glycyl-tRNA synthetase
MNSFNFIISHAKLYGFIFPSCEIYDGISSIYDYGPYGILLKNNIKDYWWKSMVQLHKNIVGLDTSILMHPTIWKASGHLDSFNDPLIDNKDSHRRYRADTLIEEYCSRIEYKIHKIIEKTRNFFGKEFDEQNFSPKIAKLKEQKASIIKRLTIAMDNKNLNDIRNLIEDLDISDTESGSKRWTDVREFSLMFKTYLGSLRHNSLELYLRPETAQGIFINFSNVSNSTRMKIPFGIAQIGKVFRNEITARQFIFRMREFEQMEMQFFIEPSKEIEWYEYWIETRFKWHLSLTKDPHFYRFHYHNQLAHYASAAIDIEFLFPFGFKEIEGIHSRTDFDLKNHQKFSGKKLHYFNANNHRHYTPYVIETSIGLDRMFLGLFSSSLKEEEISKGNFRSVLKLPIALAPVKAAILPLVKKDGLPELAEKIFNELKCKFMVIYDEDESIGKRYRRQDAIGTPFCFTVDYYSLQNYTVTVRYRDNMRQERLSINKIIFLLEEKMDINKLII